MKRRTRWIVGGGCTAALLVGLGAGWLWLVPSDEELATRIRAEAEVRLGVKVTIGAAHLQLLPGLAIVIENAATVQPQPIEIAQLVAQVDWRELLHRRLVFEHVLVDGAVVPQLSLRKLQAQPDGAGRAPAGAAPSGNKPPLALLRVHNLTWISRHGLRLEFDGSAEFDPDGRPRHVALMRPGVAPAASLTLEREGGADRWQALIRVGGGSADGHVMLKSQDDGLMMLSGRLAPQGIEVDSALAAFKRHSVVRGKASGQTLITARGRSVGQLAQSFHTRTTFAMRPATLLHIDVDKTIRSLGKDRRGQTPLESASGQVDTQNGPDGVTVRYSGVTLRSGSLSATGEATVANRHVEGEMTVDLAGGLVGVPLKFSGPLHAPQVSVPASALAGAAVGTAVLPGVGTVIGARIGAAIGRIFGHDAAPPKGAASTPARGR
jgi:hypothetical protein